MLPPLLFISAFKAELILVNESLFVRHIQRNRKNSFLGLVDFSFRSEVFAFLATLHRPEEMMQRCWGHTPHKAESLYSRSVNAR